MLEGLVKLASLTEELFYAEVVEATLENSGGILKNTPAKAPKLLHTFLRLKMGDVIIKTTTEKLQKSSKRDRSNAVSFCFKQIRRE